MYTVLEILGTVAFAISGAMVAIGKKMDLLGVVILGMTTAVGGGIVRDLLIGVTPPTALQDPRYALISLAVSVFTFLPFVRHHIDVNNMLFIVVDAIGLGTFTVVGIESVAGIGNAFLQLFLGVLTGVGGGVLRDLFASERPSIFVRHFYAAASFCGAVVCVAVYPYSKQAAMIAGMLLVVLLRVLAATFKWHLPKAED